jgi:isopentenyl diphosphate isomerase/L-lactate dehydrogenase-like FMN-dependent dehydrogenase
MFGLLFRRVAVPVQFRWLGREPASIADFRLRAARRVPRIFFDYLDGGTGDEYGIAVNRRAFDAVTLVPQFLVKAIGGDGSATIFGQRYSVPLGVSPVGVAGFIWPEAELAMARLASEFAIPFVLSMVATATMEEIFRVAAGRAWLQVYPTKDRAILSDIVDRAKDIGYTVLVATIDTPTISRRHRDIRNGYDTPFRIGLHTVWDFVRRPAWLMAMARNGIPDCGLFRPYIPKGASTPFERVAFAEAQVCSTPFDLDRLTRLRNEWPHRLVVKGVLSVEDAERAIGVGADGLIVSNHGARQLDAAPASIDALMRLVDPFASRSILMLDSGIRSGLDVVRALAVGADLTFSGRSFYYAVGAPGPEGGRRAIELLTDEYRRTLTQIGCSPRDALRLRN